MLSDVGELFSDDVNLCCCGNCVNLHGLYCLHLSRVVPSAAAYCDYHEPDELTRRERAIMLSGRG